MKSSNLKPGVYAASLTPFDSDYQVNHSLLAAHCHWLISQGCKGICLAGTTGEANSLNVKERKRMLEDVLEAGVDPSRILLGTGCCALSDTIELTTHALSLGVSGILVLPPFFYKPVANEGLHRHFSRLIDSVGHQSPNIYLYHIPQLTGIAFTKELIHGLLESHPGTVVGLKDSSNDWSHIRSMIIEFPQLDVFCGSERFLSDTLDLGGKGCISATANLTAAIANKVFENSANRANQNDQEILNEIRGSFEKFPMIAALKFALSNKDEGLDWNRLRSPLVELTNAEIEELTPLLENVNSLLITQ